MTWRYRRGLMGTLICTIELNKTTGTTVTVKDEDGKITQTVIMDGKSITLKVLKEDDKKFSSIMMDHTQIVATVKGDETSTVTQVHDTITTKVKNFILDAETIKVTSSKTSAWTAEDTMTVKVTKALSVSTSDALTVKSTKDTSVTSSAKMTLKSTDDLSASGKNVKLTADMAFNAKGGTKAEVAAAQISIKGDAKVEVAAPVTEVGDTSVTIKGAMVKVQGSIVQIG